MPVRTINLKDLDRQCRRILSPMGRMGGVILFAQPGCYPCTQAKTNLREISRRGNIDTYILNISTRGGQYVARTLNIRATPHIMRVNSSGRIIGPPLYARATKANLVKYITRG